MSGSTSSAASSTSLTDPISCIDCKTLLGTLPTGACDLIYIDPPFGTGQARKLVSGDQTRAYDDSARGGIDGFMAFLMPRIEQMHRVLATTGSLYVHLDWRTVHYIKVAIDDIFGAGNFLNEITWSYRTGGRARRWFGRKHDTILLYAKDTNAHTFHPTRQGEFRTQGMNHDEQGRPYKTTRSGRLYFHPDGPTVTDVWDIPFLSTVSSERVGYPTQKPEALLERIIKASSNEGDLVADFFCGSGTTLVTASRLDRRCLGCDLNPQAVEIATARLNALRAR